MKLYNTLTKQAEPLIPRNPPRLAMYTCGPTVYHFAHIGNLRTYIMEDVLEKYLRYEGYDVQRVMNVTDVGHLSSDGDTGEDKMLKGAKREQKSVMEIAAFYREAFFDDCRKLNIRIPDVVEPATACIKEFINMIEGLMEKGFAYQSGDNVYFDTAKTENYYALTRHTQGELLTGVREDVEEDKNKKNKADFVLWFTKSKFENQELKWESPWGLGYPGWHIECSAIAIKHLGEYVDLHCGGVDNIFPHHTNEIAQSEAFLGHEWCRHWFHVQHLKDDRGKMSKSSGDFLTVGALEKRGYDSMVYRFFCLQSHYRKPLVFRWESMDNAAQAYWKLRERTASLCAAAEQECAQEMEPIMNRYRKDFREAVGGDLNTSQGLTVLHMLLKDPSLDSAGKAALVKEFDQVLSLNLTEPLPGREKSGDRSSEDNQEDNQENNQHGTQNASAPKELESRDALGHKSKELEAYILQKIEERRLAREEKNYARADEIRQELQEKGIILKDTRTGTKWELER